MTTRDEEKEKEKKRSGVPLVSGSSSGAAAPAGTGGASGASSWLSRLLGGFRGGGAGPAAGRAAVPSAGRLLGARLAEQLAAGLGGLSAKAIALGVVGVVAFVAIGTRLVVSYAERTTPPLAPLKPKSAFGSFETPAPGPDAIRGEGLAIAGAFSAKGGFLEYDAKPQAGELLNAPPVKAEEGAGAAEGVQKPEQVKGKGGWADALKLAASGASARLRSMAGFGNARFGSAGGARPVGAAAPGGKAAPQADKFAPGKLTAFKKGGVPAKGMRGRRAAVAGGKGGSALQRAIAARNLSRQGAAATQETSADFASAAFDGSPGGAGGPAAGISGPGLPTTGPGASPGGLSDLGGGIPEYDIPDTNPPPIDQPPPDGSTPYQPIIDDIKDDVKLAEELKRKGERMIAAGLLLIVAGVALIIKAIALAGSLFGSPLAMVLMALGLALVAAGSMMVRNGKNLVQQARQLGAEAKRNGDTIKSEYGQEDQGNAVGVCVDKALEGKDCDPSRAEKCGYKEKMTSQELADYSECMGRP